MAAWPGDCKTLRGEDCPFCGRNHWHAVRGDGYEDIRESYCKRKRLPKRLRGRRLYYRLHHVRGTVQGEVIPFPSERRALAKSSFG